MNQNYKIFWSGLAKTGAIQQLKVSLVGFLQTSS